MSTQDKIDKLNEELRSLKAEQERCNHDFGESFSDPYDGIEEYSDGELERHGSDAWPIVKFRKVQKQRWTRVCRKCGLRQSTERQKDVSRPSFVPDFGND